MICASRSTPVGDSGASRSRQFVATLGRARGSPSRHRRHLLPAEPGALAAEVDRLLAAAPAGPQAKVIVLRTRATSTRDRSRRRRSRACAVRRRIERVVLVGPAHRVFVDRPRVARRVRLATPLGEIAVDTGALDARRRREPGGARARALARGRAAVPAARVAAARRSFRSSRSRAATADVGARARAAVGRARDADRDQLGSLALPAVRRRARASIEATGRADPRARARPRRRGRVRRDRHQRPVVGRAHARQLRVELVDLRSSATPPARATRSSATARSRSTRTA